MECLDTTKSLKINFKRNIGTVIIIVEGATDEFEILKQIFRKVLHYRYIEKSRNQTKFKDYDEFVMKENENSKVIVINIKNSNIKNVKENDEYKDTLFKLLYEEYGIDIKNKPVYIIWDRDNKSNDSKTTKQLIADLGNAYENPQAEMNGLLLLSYPCLESFVIDNFDDRTSQIGKVDIKQYVKDKKYIISKINRYTLLKSVVKLHQNLIQFGLNSYDTSNLSNVSLRVFEIEEEFYANKNYYKLLSFISIILIDQNIITER